MKYERILLKLSGEALMGNRQYGIDNDRLKEYAAEIKTSEPEKLKAHLIDEYRIQVPVMRHDDKVYLRYSINAFNRQEDLDKLFAAIKMIKQETNLIES